MILADTSAWVEIALGTSKGQKAKETLKSSTLIYCCVLSIPELIVWAEKNKLKSDDLLHSVSQASSYLDLSYEILRQAGFEYVQLRKIRSKIGIIDTIIYSSARIHGLTLVTCDQDFKGLPGVEMI
jgi:predicted nucleic acid-binding protein